MNFLNTDMENWKIEYLIGMILMIKYSKLNK